MLKCGGDYRKSAVTAGDATPGEHLDVSSRAFFRRFLLDHASPLHRYYRWKVFSLCQGDELFQWMINQDASLFRMEAGGPFWKPPQKDPLSLLLLDKEHSEINARIEKQRALPAGSFLLRAIRANFKPRNNDGRTLLH